MTSNFNSEEVVDLPSMFEQSRSLIAGAKIIIDSDGITDDGSLKKPTTPVILCCSLSIEICLKLLIMQEKGKSIKNHDLVKLYALLPSTHSSGILAKCILNDVVQNVDELLALIESHKNIFVNWRYAFEQNSELECSPTFLYGLAYSLSIYIEEQYSFARNNNGWLAS